MMDWKKKGFINKHARQTYLAGLFFCLALFHSAPINATNFETGKAAYLDGNYEDALRIFKSLAKEGITSIKELATIESIGENHPWFDQQVELVKQIRSNFTEDIVSVYNIFAPLTHLKWQVSNKTDGGDEQVASFLKEDPETLREVLKVIAHDIATLAKKVITEAGADGMTISGAGPAVFAITNSKKRAPIIENAMIRTFLKNGVECSTLITSPSSEGSIKIT